MTYKIGVDGGATKTECILVNEAGIVVESHSTVGCNPSLTGAEKARTILLAALDFLKARAATLSAKKRAVVASGEEISLTLLCMAGSPLFWREFASGLPGFGRVIATDDSVPTVQLATHGQPGLVLHGGTGSFVAARGMDGSLHYAGGLGWRLGDPGSGYELGRRAVARALLDLQGWEPAPRLAALVCAHTGLSDAAGITRTFYQEADPNARIAALAPGVLGLAAEGDVIACKLVVDSAMGLLDLAGAVARKLFPGISSESLRAGLSGPILRHPFVARVLMSQSEFKLFPVEDSPIEGVRSLLAEGVFEKVTA